MNKKIIVLSRHQFIKFYNSLTERQRSEICFISIRDAEFDIIQPDSDNFLNLSFDDAEEINIPIISENVVVQLFNDNMAQQIFDHVEQNKNKNCFVVHCLMGQSRSGAVGGFINDYFRQDYIDFKRQNPQIKPNALVHSLLNKKLYE